MLAEFGSRDRSGEQVTVALQKASGDGAEIDVVVDGDSNGLIGKGQIVTSTILAVVGSFLAIPSA